MTLTTVETAVLTRIEPFSILFERPSGRILAVGATTRKVAPGLEGLDIGAAVRLSRPIDAPATAEALLASSGARLKLTLTREAGTRHGDHPSSLHGVVHPLGPDRGLLLMSFGETILNAVARHQLDCWDFGVTNPTVDLLFAIEARTSVEGIARDLQVRLDDALNSAKIQAETDTLTGLANRRALERHLACLFAEEARTFGVLHLDLDHFKEVNDGFGHAAGDAVLRRVADILREEVRRGDLAARIGGDEFVVILADCDTTDRLVAIGERLVARLEAPVPFEGHLCRISASVGVTVSSRARDPAALLEDSDRALYAAKRSGRSRVNVAA